MRRCSNPAAPETKRVRRAQVAGSWYPGDKEHLGAYLDEMLAEVKPPKVDGKVMALDLAARWLPVFGQGRGDGLRASARAGHPAVIVLAISHHLPFHGASIADVTHFETPLGLIPSTARLWRACAQPGGQRGRAGRERGALAGDAAALASARAAELQPGADPRRPHERRRLHRAGEGLGRDRRCAHPGRGIERFHPPGDNYGYEVPAGKGTIQERLARVDDGSVEQILKLRRRGLLDHADRSGTTICGLHPIALLLELLAKFQGTRGQVVSRYTSGDVTSDWSSSVTYVDVAFTGKWPEHPNSKRPGQGEKKCFHSAKKTVRHCCDWRGRRLKRRCVRARSTRRSRRRSPARRRSNARPAPSSP
jgi:predicted class III extradiol MEMO1 family dioxygenase